MKTMLWSPWLSTEGDMRSAMARFDRLFGEERSLSRPAVDAYTKDNELIFEIELPGVNIDEDVTIEILDDVLQIEGKTERTSEYDREGFHIAERHFGSFHRQLPLPDGVDPDAVKAEFDAGVLTVRVPLPADVTVTEPRKIPVKRG